MSTNDQRAFDAILSIAQNLLRRTSTKTGLAITPEMIDAELNKLAMLMEDDFAVVDREQLVDELIRRYSHTVGRNATLSDDSDHVPWLTAERKRG